MIRLMEAHPKDNAAITQLLAAYGEDKQTSEALYAAVYGELKQIARNRMAMERSGHTLTPTALVHDAYLRLTAGSNSQWQNRKHFFAAAAEAMRRILIESARRRLAQRRRGEHVEITLSNLADKQQQVDDAGILALDQALSDLESHDANMAAVVKLRYFAGMTIAETAELMEVSPRTIDRLWMAARAWLIRAMED